MWLPPQKEIDNVVDIIRNPPLADPYGTLRAHLLQMHSLTDYGHCESIMSLPMSGDMFPSALLARMRALFPIEHQECLFLRYAFLWQLPADVRSHLVHDKSEDITVLSQRANEIHRSSLTTNPSVNVVDSAHTVHAPSFRQYRQVQRSQSAPSPVPCRSQTPAAPSRHSSSPSFCWYHAKFGAKALSCQAPSSWSGN